MSSPVRVLSLGRFAQAALASGGPARLIAAFERSGYVDAADGLACVGAPAIGNGPLNALLAEFPRGLSVGDSLDFDLADAIVWKPRAAPVWDAKTVAESITRLGLASAGLLPVEGFGYLLKTASEMPPPVAALARWLAEPVRDPEGAQALIGLGPGLTPAGDDLLGGAMCALYAAGRPGLAKRLAAWALPLAAAGTSRISRAHLDCAAQGECGEAVNDAIVALLSGGEPDLARIDAIGHTSGWDALAGAALALKHAG